MKRVSLRKILLIALLGLLVAVALFFLYQGYAGLPTVAKIGAFSNQQERDIYDAVCWRAWGCFITSGVCGLVLGVCVPLLYRIVRDKRLRQNT